MVGFALPCPFGQLSQNDLRRGRSKLYFESPPLLLSSSLHGAWISLRLAESLPCLRERTIISLSGYRTPISCTIPPLSYVLHGSWALFSCSLFSHYLRVFVRRLFLFSCECKILSSTFRLMVERMNRRDALIVPLTLIRLNIFLG